MCSWNNRANISAAPCLATQYTCSQLAFCAFMAACVLHPWIRPSQSDSHTIGSARRVVTEIADCLGAQIRTLPIECHYRQSGKLVRFDKSARSLKSHDVSRLSAPKTFKMAPERGSEPRPGRRIRVRIRYGSYTDPIHFSRIRAFSRVKTYYVWTDPIRPLYPCIILIKGSDGFRGRLPAGGTGQGPEGGKGAL